jgi:hypothetical protein
MGLCGDPKIAQLTLVCGGGIETQSHGESVMGRVDFTLGKIEKPSTSQMEESDFDKGIPACIRLSLWENISFEEASPAGR